MMTETSTAVRPRSPWVGGNFWIRPARSHIWFTCIGEQTVTPLVDIAGGDPPVALVWKSDSLTVMAAEESTPDGIIQRVTVTHRSRWPQIGELAAVRDVFFEIGDVATAILPRLLDYRNGITICRTRETTS